MVNIKNPQSNLPPGFRFHPTDEELILHYLRKKVSSKPVPVSIVADVDIYKFDPWDLPAKAPFGEKEWYFFSPRDRKYPNGARPNRAAASGYWKATGTDKIIVAPPMVAGGIHGGSENIGVKKALVFYKGRPPKGLKTNWIMHEYRLTETSNYTNIKTVKSKNYSMRLDDWVLCRIYKKTNALSLASTAAASDQDQEEEETEQFIQEALLTTPPSNSSNPLKPQKSCSFSNLLDAMDYSMLSSFLADNTLYDSNIPFPSGNLEQSLFNNGNYSNSGSSNNNNHLLQKLPQLSSPAPVMENRLKRQNSDIDEGLVQPSKKFIASCNYSNSSSQFDVAQYSLLNQSFLNQSLLLSPHLQFQG